MVEGGHGTVHWKSSYVLRASEKSRNESREEKLDLIYFLLSFSDRESLDVVNKLHNSTRRIKKSTIYRRKKKSYRRKLLLELLERQQNIKIAFLIFEARVGWKTAKRFLSIEKLAMLLIYTLLLQWKPLRNIGDINFTIFSSRFNDFKNNQVLLFMLAKWNDSNLIQKLGQIIWKSQNLNFWTT